MNEWSTTLNLNTFLEHFFGIVDKKWLSKSLLTNKRSFPQVTTAFQYNFQELDLLIHHIVFRLQRNPSPVQSKMLVP